MHCAIEHAASTFTRVTKPDATSAHDAIETPTARGIVPRAVFIPLELAAVARRGEPFDG